MNEVTGRPGTTGGTLVKAEFRPAWWARSPHLQTLYPYLLRHRPRPDYQRQRLELDDGDFLDLDLLARHRTPHAWVLVVHGLEGNSGSHYARGLSAWLDAHGCNVAIVHFRGCGGTPNRLDRSYHSGDTGDLQQAATWFRQRYPDTPLMGVGFSLGGNVILKYLGERGQHSLLDAAVAVSVPFDLARAADRLECGFSRLYQRYLVHHMRHSVRRKFAGRPAPISLTRMAHSRTFRQFDDCVTAPLNGFADAADYYRRSSCRQFLSGIRVPTLILHASDDPFLPPDAIPTAAELPAAIRLELSKHGGHVGFLQGSVPWRPRYWLDRRIGAYLCAN